LLAISFLSLKMRKTFITINHIYDFTIHENTAFCILGTVTVKRKTVTDQYTDTATEVLAVLVISTITFNQLDGITLPVDCGLLCWNTVKHHTSSAKLEMPTFFSLSLRKRTSRNLVVYRNSMIQSRWLCEILF
jgi:hypothetical protein